MICLDKMRYWQQVHHNGASWFRIIRFLLARRVHDVGDIIYHDEPANMADDLK